MTAKEIQSAKNLSSKRGKNSIWTAVNNGSSIIDLQDQIISKEIETLKLSKKEKPTAVISLNKDQPNSKKAVVLDSDFTALTNAFFAQGVKGIETKQTKNAF